MQPIKRFGARRSLDQKRWQVGTALPLELIVLGVYQFSDPIILHILYSEPLFPQKQNEMIISNSKGCWGLCL